MHDTRPIHGTPDGFAAPGRRQQACEACVTAVALSASPPVQRFLRARARALQG